MGEVGTDSPLSLKQQLLLAGLLLKKYGILSDFHGQQLKNYPIACCHISLGGTIQLNLEAREVFFDIQTYRFYKTVDGEITRRHRLSPFGMIKVKSSKYYEEQVELAKTNILTWTQELLWGPNTQIRINIDGRSIT